jgi:hypothetical protein
MAFEQSPFAPVHAQKSVGAHAQDRQMVTDVSVDRVANYNCDAKMNGNFGNVGTTLEKIERLEPRMREFARRSVGT